MHHCTGLEVNISLTFTLSGTCQTLCVHYLFLILKIIHGASALLHSWNPSYLQGGDQENFHSRPAQAKYSGAGHGGVSLSSH
jgi:hypothetical protein